MESFARSGTSLNPPTRDITSLDPLIPQPLARIGNTKTEKKSIMSVANNKLKHGVKTNDLKNSNIDAYDILHPSLEQREFDQTHHDKSDLDYQYKNNRAINREAALVRAMTSAGITHTLTKNCSTGDFTNCVCDR